MDAGRLGVISLANISTFLQKIMEAVYGEEVRGSIHDALAAMNVESSEAMRFAATAKDSAAASALDAKASAATAEQKATEIVASAQAAKTSENNAKTSETNAATKAAEAVTAAAGAKASETAAGNSEAIATQKAQEAADSQSAAAQSEAEAKAAGAQATADKNAAEAAKEAAEAAADDATIAETNAKLSENTALVAQAAAEVAKDDAEAAKLAAQNAKTAAETAKDDAEDAKDKAKASEDAAAASALSAQQYSGKPPKPQDGTWWIWDAAQQKYVNTGIGCELTGPTGNGIQTIALTSGDHTPGTTDIYTVTMTDGTTTTISVYNGRNGTGAGDVLGIAFDLVLPASGWVNGELTVADSRLLALATHKYFIDADETSREEYLECGVQARNITTTGFITFKNDTDPTADLTVNVIRLELSANGS